MFFIFNLITVPLKEKKYAIKKHAQFKGLMQWFSNYFHF